MISNANKGPTFPAIFDEMGAYFKKRSLRRVSLKSRRNTVKIALSKKNISLSLFF